MLIAMTELTALVHKVENRHPVHLKIGNGYSSKVRYSVMGATPEELRELRRVAWKDGPPHNSLGGYKARGRFSKKVES